MSWTSFFVQLILVHIVVGQTAINQTETIGMSDTVINNTTRLSEKTLILSDIFIPENQEPNPSLSSDLCCSNPSYIKVDKYYLKPIALNLLNQLNPANLVKPIQEKVERIREYLFHPNNPAYGGIQLLNPQQIWERFHETSNHFLTGINGAIFGLRPVENHDYPFPYRKLSRSIKQ